MGRKQNTCGIFQNRTASLDSLEADFTRLRELVLIPGTRKVEHKALSAEIKTDKSAIIKVLKNELDVMVKFFIENDPKFVAEYGNARSIVDVHGKRRGKTDIESQERDVGQQLAS